MSGQDLYFAYMNEERTYTKPEKCSCNGKYEKTKYFLGEKLAANNVFQCNKCSDYIVYEG